MPTYRNGNFYRIGIGKETSYGSGKTNATSIAWTELTVLPDKLEFSGSQTQIETGAKTGTGLPITGETRGGYKNYTLTLSGMLSHEHERLLTAITADSASPYVIDSLPALDSYVIVRVWGDAPSGNNYTVDIAKGCKLQKLTFTGASGDVIRYEAAFMIKERAREVTQQITGTDPGTPSPEGFNFGNITDATELCFGDTEHLKSFSLSIGYDLADDASSYQNSLERLDTIPLKANCEFNYVTNYDASNASYDKIAESLLFGAAAITEVLVFANPKAAWAIRMHGQLIDYQLADPDRALFENNVTEKLCYYPPSTYPLTITVTQM